MKLTKSDIDKVRHIEGFPTGNDEDIIALSNPPYYTACPNPFIEDFINEYGKPYDAETDNYKRDPFAADVSEGKAESIYNVHSYHTKVPPKAIVRYILNYTNPGDIVFDGFCGSGMTGVAAKLCGSLEEEYIMKLEKEMKNIEWGDRRAILSDLSPYATFIASNYNKIHDFEQLNVEFNRVIDEVEQECSWLYKTKISNKDNHLSLFKTDVLECDINYIIWSEMLICPICSSEYNFWNQAVDQAYGKVKDAYECPYCKGLITKKESKRVEESLFDHVIGKAVTHPKLEPVIINYTLGKKRYDKSPNEFDIELINKIKVLSIPYEIPVELLPDGYNTRQPIRSHGYSYIHDFYTNRNLYVLACLYDKARNSNYTNELMFLFTAIRMLASRNTKVQIKKYFSKGQFFSYVTGTLYIPSLNIEGNVLSSLKNRVKTFNNLRILDKKDQNVIISTQSSTDLINIPSNSVDYIFIDPPFGDNINYSELNSLWEGWLKVHTNNAPEAIMNPIQNKALLEYQGLMEKCFNEFNRILKPERWMTIVFSNSKNSVWNSIKEALNKAGFIIADIRTLDKKQGSFKQVTSTTAVKQDLVISAYKHKEAFKKEIVNNIGTEETVWMFVREHLKHLPIVVKNNDTIEVVRERESFALYDRMVAFHIINNMSVPISASDFHKSIADRFLERDGMFFLHDQINKYDEERMSCEVQNIQLSIFIMDEKSAVSWLYQELIEPQTYSELQPKFLKELKVIRYEKMPELLVLLEENFLQDEQGKWYIPDPTKVGDIIKLREKRLLKEFEEYLIGKGKLKLFRTEAIRVGFAKLWKNKDYQSIVNVANRLPEKVIQEDDKLLMYYDISLSRVE